MSKIITGLFNDERSAAAAIMALEVSGVPESDLSLIASGAVNRDSFAIQDKSKIAEGTALGATTGGAVGALVAGLTAAGAVATGGAGLLIAGPLVAALAGAGAGAAGGSILGGAIGFSIPENEIKHHEDALKKGSMLVGVNCDEKDDDRRDAIKNTLEECGATKVSHA